MPNNPHIVISALYDWLEANVIMWPKQPPNGPHPHTPAHSHANIV